MESHNMSRPNGRDGEYEQIDMKEIDLKDSHTMSQNKALIDWNAIFTNIDPNHNGSITCADLKKYLLRFPMSHVLLTNDMVDSLLCHVNYKNDQWINQEELQKLVNLPVDADRQSVVIRSLVTIVTYAAPRSQITHGHRHYISQYSCWIPPFFIILICAAQIGVAVFYGTVKSKTGGDEGWYLFYHPDVRAEAWRFISYMFIHQNYYHLAGNVVLALVFGIPLEMVHRTWRISILYMGGIILGPLALSSLYSKDQLAGSSGGVYALLAAHISNTLINWSVMPLRWWRLLILLIFTATGICLHISMLHESIVPHASGAVAGLLLGMIALRNLKERKWEKFLKWIGLIIYLGIVVACIICIIIQERNPTFDGLLDDFQNITTTPEENKEMNSTFVGLLDNFQNITTTPEVHMVP